MSTISQLFGWAAPRKKRVFFFVDGSSHDSGIEKYKIKLGMRYL
jgi:hypothetical protein